MTDSNTYRSSKDNSFSLMIQSPQNPNNQERKTNNPNDKNGTRMRRKNDGDDNNFAIDLDRVLSLLKMYVLLISRLRVAAELL